MLAVNEAQLTTAIFFNEAKKELFLCKSNRICECMSVLKDLANYVSLFLKLFYGRVKTPSQYIYTPNSPLTPCSSYLKKQEFCLLFRVEAYET